MMFRSLLVTAILTVTVLHAYGAVQQLQIPVAAELQEPNDDLQAQVHELQKNVSELWTYIYELRSAVSFHLTHLRQHQVELESTVHRLEHSHEGDSHAHSSHGEMHSHGDDHHSHDDDHHSHGEDHSHSDDQHSHGEDQHAHSREHHSHSDEHHSHGDEHSHSSYSHSHSHTSPGHDHTHEEDDHSHSGHGDDHSHSGHEDDHSHSGHGDDHSHSGHGDDHHSHDHKDSHENENAQQETQQVSDPVAEPIVVPTNRQEHYHHHVSQVGRPSAANSMDLMNETGHGHHYHHSHHHDSHHSSDSRSRNRTIVPPKYSDYHLYDFAVCNVQPNRAIPAEKQQEVNGQITMWQKKTGGPLNVHVRLQGFKIGDHHAHHEDDQQTVQQEDNETPPHSSGHRHGFHVHALGDLSNGCQSTGGHFNPKSVNHGAADALVRHIGDFGNIECDDRGITNILLSDDLASLKGPYSIYGKAFVIHSDTDDLGLGGDAESLKTGNAGTRIACCVIERVEKLPIRNYKAMKTASQYKN